MSNDESQVYAAFARAMKNISAVGKNDRNTQQGFMFRGIDAVMTAVGPRFRDEGIFLIPEVISHKLEQVTSSRGKAMMSAVLTMRYTVAHEDGSTFAGTVVGEATDFADKATSKAASVALRTFLLQSLVLPTDEPDPDHSYNEVSPMDVAAAKEQQREALVPKIAAAKTVEECRSLWQACSAVGLTDEIKARVAEIEAGDGGE